jgi:hypothetical protein
MIPSTIDEDSPSVDVYSAVRGFIYTDSDGSKRVNVDGLSAWLAAQFSAIQGGGASLTSKSETARAIAQTLQNSIGREAFRTRDDYPRGETGAVNVDVTNQLIDLQAQIEGEVRKADSAYRSFQDGVNAMLKTAFSTALSESITGIKLQQVTRSYVETFVTDRGEESAPSPAAALATLDQNDTANVTGSAAPAGRFITKRRLYRSATTTNSAVWRLQGEYPATQTLIADDKSDEQLLPDVLATTGWLEPPNGLQGLTGMSNGIMVGYVGSTLHACEPYAPYAWPAKYDKPLPHKIMGTAAIGQSVLVGTTGFPYLVSGSDSMSLTEQKLPTLVPCVSAASMVPVANSVFYASPDGLALYENGAVAVVTEGIIDRADWARYNPASMRGAGFDGRYFAFYTKGDATRGCLVFDYKSRTIAEMAQPADAVFANQNGLYVLDGTQILNALPADGAARSGTWKSKAFRLAKPQAFFWLHVDSDFAAGAVTVRIYADGVLHHTATVADRAPLRLPPGRHHDWTVDVESASDVNGIVLASTTNELKAVL